MSISQYTFVVLQGTHLGPQTCATYTVRTIQSLQVLLPYEVANPSGLVSTHLTFINVILLDQGDTSNSSCILMCAEDVYVGVLREHDSTGNSKSLLNYSFSVILLFFSCES